MGTMENIGSPKSHLCRKGDLLPNLKAVARAIEQTDRAIVDPGRFVKWQVGSIGKETPTNLTRACELGDDTGKVISHPTHMRDI
jgi:hypothetical protein